MLQDQPLILMCWPGLWCFRPQFCQPMQPAQKPAILRRRINRQNLRASDRAAKVRARATFRMRETAKINLDAVQRELKASKLVAAGIASEAIWPEDNT